ncbi:MAG: flotillin family protein [Actinomycetia bacterium]|nr:flotillin family protein [Actinomycetes bacterium]
MSVVIAGVIVLVAILAAFLAVRSLIVICPPNRVAVISGRKRTLSDGRTVGYRVLKGGRTYRVPMLERVDWVELNTMPIEVSVTNAFSKGAIPLNVQGIANVKVSSTESLLSNSVERFLDTDQDHIAQIAKETLEANLRGVLATLTPEEVNEDRLKFSQTLIEEADDDVKVLGLELDTLKIQNVTDEVGYLESVGRRRTAEVLKSARVAEAERSAESEEAEARGRQRAEIAAANANLQIVEEQNTLRVRTAELEGVAVAKEAEAKVAGEKARVVAQQDLEQERIELERKRLEADVVAPARAELEASRLAAQAEAATIIEDGKAQVEVFERLVAQYKAAGDDAQRIFVLNMLPDLVDRIASTVEGVAIDRISVIDSGGQGSGIPGVLGQLPAAVINLAEQMETATGVDILSSMRPSGSDDGGDGGSASSKADQRSSSGGSGSQPVQPSISTASTPSASRPEADGPTPPQAQAAAEPRPTPRPSSPRRPPSGPSPAKPPAAGHPPAGPPPAPRRPPAPRQPPAPPSAGRTPLPPSDPEYRLRGPGFD